MAGKKGNSLLETRRRNRVLIKKYDISDGECEKDCDSRRIRINTSDNYNECKRNAFGGDFRRNTHNRWKTCK